MNKTKDGVKILHKRYVNSEAEKKEYDQELDRLRRWRFRRSKVYTKKGIDRMKCVRCGARATNQWTICSLSSYYWPVCNDCDVGLNKVVLDFMDHPHMDNVISQYRDDMDGGHV